RRPNRHGTVTMSISPDATPITWVELSIVGGALGFCGLAVASGVAWLWGKLAKQQQALDNFRVEVAKEYVSAATLAGIERRLESAITELRQDMGRSFNQIVQLLNGTKG